MSPWRKIMIVFHKERRDHVRDRRSLILSMIFPLLAPLLVGSLLYFVAQTNIQTERDAPVEAAVSGKEFAPGLIAYLEAHNVTIRSAPVVREYQELAVKNGELPFILVIPESAQGKDRFAVDLMVNQGSPPSMAKAATVLRHLNDYNRQLATRMIETAGLDPGILNPVGIRQIGVGNPINIAYLFYNIIPSLLMFMIFMGAVYLAIDVTVGERERGSLESLVATPISRIQLLLGKALAAYFFTAIIVLINLSAFYAALHWATSGVDNIAPPPDILVFLKLFLLAVPLMAFAVGLQMTIAFVTRSAKEAQIYLGLLPIVPLVPGLIMVFNPVEATGVVSAIPIYGQLALFIDVIEGNPAPLVNVLSSVFGALAAAFLTFSAAGKLFEREKTVIGG